jgi:hypothetical protein
VIEPRGLEITRNAVISWLWLVLYQAFSRAVCPASCSLFFFGETESLCSGEEWVGLGVPEAQTWLRHRHAVGVQWVSAGCPYACDHATMHTIRSLLQRNVAQELQCRARVLPVAPPPQQPLPLPLQQHTQSIWRSSRTRRRTTPASTQYATSGSCFSGVDDNGQCDGGEFKLGGAQGGRSTRVRPLLSELQVPEWQGLVVHWRKWRQALEAQEVGLFAQRYDVGQPRAQTK